MSVNKKNTSPNSSGENGPLEMKSFYLWNCGIINSFQNVEKFIVIPAAAAESSKNVVSKDLSFTSQPQYILQLDSSLEQQNQQRMIVEPLRNAKIALQELSLENTRLNKYMGELTEDKEQLLENLDRVHALLNTSQNKVAAVQHEIAQ